MNELTEREREILETILSEGYSNAEIAAKFGITCETVKRHMWAIMNKTGYSTRLEMAVKMLHERYRR